MASTINTNIQSLTAQRNLSMSQASLTTSMQRLSSGLRINSAKDDAAGLAITDRMTSQIRGLNQAARNANDGISLAQVAEGALGSTSSNLQRIRELAVQAANGTNSASDRLALQQEVMQLTTEISRVGSQTEFNGLKLLDGSYTTQQFQVGANANQTIGVSVTSARAVDMGNNAVKSSTTAPSLATAAVGPSLAGAANGFLSQTLTLAGNGTVNTIPASGALAAGSSAKAIATAINAFTALSGVTAVGTTKATISGVSLGSVQFQLQGSNLPPETPITVSATINNTSDLAPLAQAINAQSGSTGITAVADKTGKLVLTQADGDDIKILNMNATGGLAGATMIGEDAVTPVTFLPVGGTATPPTSDLAVAVGGKVALNSSTGFTLTSTDATGTLIAGGSQGSALSSVAKIDISTQDGANAALLVVDGALASISANRAQLGAVQNRFLTTIENLQTNSENLSASRSRIQDADFAMETANLSRTQILQQAGTAMVAQANQLPQGVLQLLKG
ncbi:B-type flagellin [Comamonadaceae bacterium OS-4]|nr:B-type flagellin [Comamonadaceae bacterium OS-4]